MSNVRPITTPLPATGKLFESLYQGRRPIKSEVKAIMVYLWDNDRKFVELLMPEYDEQSTHGRYKLDQAFAAERIIVEAAKRGLTHIVALKTYRVRQIMLVILKDRKLDRQSRINGLVAHATRGDSFIADVTADDTDAAE